MQLTLEQIDVIRRLTEVYHPSLTLCTSAEGKLKPEIILNQWLTRQRSMWLDPRWLPNLVGYLMTFPLRKSGYHAFQRFANYTPKGLRLNKIGGIAHILYCFSHLPADTYKERAPTILSASFVFFASRARGVL